ncbi:MAG: serine hydrolase [Saprospiraceae bacterium]
MKYLTLKIIILILVIPNLSSSQNEIPAFINDSLDIYVNRALRDWRIPGCAVAIVKNGKVIVSKGYGIRDLESRMPVDEHTQFMIASNTKAVTGICLAKLEQEKILSLNDPVTKWLPWFKLYDKNATELVTIKDILTHRIGFETFQGDFSHWNTNTSRREVIERMAKIKPVYGFRDRWGYCNAGYTVAGEIIYKSSGLNWEQYITKNLFEPLGLTETHALNNNFINQPNHCTPYTIYNNEILKLTIPNLNNLAPAASICSSVSDWIKWVQLILDEGNWNGKEIISPAAIKRSMQAMSIRGAFNPRFNSGHFNLYGLGWLLQDYHKHKIVSHTGGADGFVSSVTLLPEEELGIVVFTNTDANNFYEALKWELVDAFLGLPYRNYSNLMLPEFTKYQLEDLKWLKSVRDSVDLNLIPPIPLKKFTGNYSNSVYGTMKITQEANFLKASFQHHLNQDAKLEYMGQDRFLCTYSNPTLGIKVIPFKILKKKVVSLSLSCADFIEFTPYEFIKK